MKYLLFFVYLLLVAACASRRTSDSVVDAPQPPPEAAVQDTSATEEVKEKKGYKDYSEVITEEAVTDEGLFDVHRVEEKYYFEIPFDLLDRDMLLVSRIAKIPANLGGGYMNAGSKTNEQLVRWQRVDDRIHLRTISYGSVADSTLPISQSVQNNNYAPIVAAFDIKTYGEDSTTAVIQVDDLFGSDVKAISGLSKSLRKRYEVRSLDKSRSFISRMASFPENVEVRHDMTYVSNNPPSNARTGTISMQLSQSMYLLPEEPMQPRLHDERVGWFTVRQIDYGSDALKSDQKEYIKRWKMTPKDKEAYARGELVEPEEPIVYYLDPATPEKWRPYFRQGIEDWQKAFEEAGFKNAIIARDAPTDDPDWSPEDARYSVVRYVASTTRNAIGPSVSDPRSGQIIESDIIWYHNHLRSYRNRYLLETGAANPSARTLNTPEEEIGEMMRRVISHEVGHALGLPHNMKASYAYPVDSLRSASFTNTYGLASTIMDYTRYNYVAQPGDEGVRFVRMLGPYDLYAIDWGYRYIPEANSPEEEKPILNEWIAEKADDPMYLFGGRGRFDPSSQTESVGDDPVRASEYGMKNLRIVAENLADWTSTPGENHDDVRELYGELLSVWGRYAAHVTTNIGGVYERLRTTDDDAPSYQHLKAEEQRAAMEFLHQEVFATPEWLMPKRVVENLGPSGLVERIKRLQTRQLDYLLRADRLERMIENEAMNGREAYTPTEMLDDLRRGLWSEVSSRRPISVYRRNLQRAHVQRLLELLEQDSENPTDIGALARAELRTIKSTAERAANRYPRGVMRYHLSDIADTIDGAMDKTRAR